MTDRDSMSATASLEPGENWTAYTPKQETILEEAARLTTRDRQDRYGPPLDDLSRTGRMWGAILGIADVPAETVALCMVALKLSRESHSPFRDNRVDGCGYFNAADMIHAERARRGRT